MINGVETRLAPLAEALRTGQLSLQTYLEQLEAEFDSENERIEAVLPEEGRFERLRRDAQELEARYPDPASRPALYGVLVGVKDIFHVDGFETRAGSRLPVDTLAGREATSVRHLKGAGALILGKTVTTEFAYFGPGPTRNPYNVEHTPGGSSSGSAAAIASGLCPLALGTQTVGSIIRPAAFCGVIGFKPSSGRIATGGVIPLSPTLDHVGFFTQDIPGAQLAASVLLQGWRHVSPTPARQLTLGVPKGAYLERTTHEGLARFHTMQDTLSDNGFKIAEVEAFEDFDEIIAWHSELMAYEAAQVHQAWFEEYGDRYHPKTAALIERGHQVAPESIPVYQANREQVRNDLISLMEEKGIDMWIAPPAIGTAPFGLESTGDPVMNLPWTYAGLPALTVPAVVTERGLPLGLQLVGHWQQDEELLAYAERVADAVLEVTDSSLETNP